MSKPVPFIHKFLKHIGKIDREQVEGHFSDLLAELRTYEEILDQAGEGMILTGTDARVHFINRQAQAQLGIYSTPAAKSRIQDLIQDGELSRFIESHLVSLKQKVVGEIHLLVPKEARVRVSLVPVQNQILILFSPSQQRESAGDARLARVESLVSLAAGIAHEIGNPLNSIGIHLQLLKKEVKALPESKKAHFEKTLEVLYAETARLDRIVKNFLKATRKPPLRFKPDQLNEIAEAAIEFLKPELKTHKITVHYDGGPKLPLFLMDRERIYQAFINLIKNSMEAMPDGGRLWIKITRRENAVLLTFKDEGCGIEDADLPHIFEAYYTTKEEGSGLGLLTVFNAVKEHGGRIEVASKRGKGTTFSLILPMRQPKLQLPGMGGR
jgi:signal transduction histidine kinase